MTSQTFSVQEQQIIDAAIEFVKAKLAKDSSGHDWWHIYRVWQTAKKLAQAESADLFIVELAALLHDVADHKLNTGKDACIDTVVGGWLDAHHVDQAIKAQVLQIIHQVSFKGANVATPMSTLEGQIVQDADRLDAIGAIGIGRAFAYGGHKNRLMYDPDENPTMHDSFETYKSSQGTTINHFHEKLLLLKDRMNTKAGKQLAQERHQFMMEFLDQFDRQWWGK